MKPIVEWAALTVVILVLYLMDLKHIASSEFNTFIMILFGMITGLVLVLKKCHRPHEPDNKIQEKRYGD